MIVQRSVLVWHFKSGVDLALAFGMVHNMYAISTDVF